MKECCKIANQCTVVEGKGRGEHYRILTGLCVHFYEVHEGILVQRKREGGGLNYYRSLNGLCMPSYKGHKGMLSLENDQMM